MTCKCGQAAEIQQPNIFDEVETLCRDCFNGLGHHPEEDPFDVIEWNRLRAGYSPKEVEA